MGGQVPGTTGGWRGMNGTQRRILAGAAALFMSVVGLILVANAESTLTDLAAAGAPVPPRLVWSWEVTSMVAWMTLWPGLWWAVARLRPPRVRWPVVMALAVAGSVIASAWHVALMVALRHLYYAAAGAGAYSFGGAGRFLYEYRKDVPTYVQFVALAALVQWLVARAAMPTPQPRAEERVLLVPDGAMTHRLPIDEIDRVEAAGNYVELGWRGGTLLHRATLAAVEAELGDGFVRLGRSRIVRRAAIRRVANDRSGDFTVTLADGTEVKGSRRYRAGVAGDAGV